MLPFGDGLALVVPQGTLSSREPAHATPPGVNPSVFSVPSVVATPQVQCASQVEVSRVS